jgi:hypothetical protein
MDMDATTTAIVAPVKTWTPPDANLTAVAVLIVPATPITATVHIAGEVMESLMPKLLKVSLLLVLLRQLIRPPLPRRRLRRKKLSLNLRTTP